MRGALRFPWKNILTNFREVVCYWVTDGEGRAQEAVGSLREVNRKGVSFPLDVKHKGEAELVAFICESI